MQKLKPAITILLGLLGLLLYACVDTTSTISTIDEQKLDVQPTEQLSEPAPAEVVYQTEAGGRLSLKLNVRNSRGEMETLVSIGPRNFVTSGSQSYDFFEVGMGELKAAALLRNDTAQLSMAYVVNTEKTMSIWNQDPKAMVKSSYDSVFIFDHAPKHELDGTFGAKISTIDLAAEAESLGISTKEFTERVRISVIEASNKLTAKELLSRVANDLKASQEAQLAKNP